MPTFPPISPLCCCLTTERPGLPGGRHRRGGHRRSDRAGPREGPGCCCTPRDGRTPSSSPGGRWLRLSSRDGDRLSEAGTYLWAGLGAAQGICGAVGRKGNGAEPAAEGGGGRTVERSPSTHTPAPRLSTGCTNSTGRGPTLLPAAGAPPPGCCCR